MLTLNNYQDPVCNLFSSLLNDLSVNKPVLRNREFKIKIGNCFRVKVCCLLTGQHIYLSPVRKVRLNAIRKDK